MLECLQRSLADDRDAMPVDLGAESYHKIESRGMDLWSRERDAQRWTIFRYNNSSHNTLLVNGRHVQAPALLHAVMQGYRQRLMKGQFPVAVCHVTVPADRVDVNVHPTKHEVRFVHQRDVHGVVAGAVAAAPERAERGRRPGTMPSAPSDRSLPSHVAETMTGYPPPPIDHPVSSAPGETQALPAFVRPTSGPIKPQQTDLWRQGRFALLNVIGQFRRTYILCESDEGLVIIDQHAAHERVYYEQLHQRRQSINAAAQKLLLPETLELSHREAALLEGLREALAPLGFDIDPFGGTTFAIKAAPVMLLNGEIGPVIREILEKALAAGRQADPEGVLDEAIKIMACHGAIRARQALNDRQIRRLLQQLDECDNPSHCPHGRPTWIRWTQNDLEKAFGRQG